MSLEPRRAGRAQPGAAGPPGYLDVRMPQPVPGRMRPTWRQASPARIAAFAGRSAAVAIRAAGSWSGPARRTDRFARSPEPSPDGRSSSGATRTGLWSPVLVPVRTSGALLDRCTVTEGTLFCRWHGYGLTPAGDNSWRPYRAFDDGLLIWVGLTVDGETPTERPTLPPRPPLDASVSSVMIARGSCEPQDVIANRLDPWHGAWFHPYAFSHLTVDESASNDEVLTVDVAFRLNHTWGVPVRAEFFCPDARTIVMRITEGEGTRSLVETHATPIGVDAAGDPVTIVTEATIAYSDRTGFKVAPGWRP